MTAIFQCFIFFLCTSMIRWHTRKYAWPNMYTKCGALRGQTLKKYFLCFDLFGFSDDVILCNWHVVVVLLCWTWLVDINLGQITSNGLCIRTTVHGKYEATKAAISFLRKWDVDQIKNKELEHQFSELLFNSNLLFKLLLA